MRSFSTTGNHGLVPVDQRAVSKHLARLGIATVIVVLIAGSASAHRVDLVKPGRRLGPIKFGRTTLAQTKEWFGNPTQRKGVKLCESYPYTRIKWGRKLKIFFYKSGDDYIASLGSVHRHRIKSSQHGILGMHTSKGLRVTNRYAKSRRLYPNASVFRQSRNRYIHYLVHTPSRGSLYAYSQYRKGNVRGLYAGPYETC